MGTAITDEQVAALSGMVEEVVLALDADSAGQEAMLRAQQVAADRRMRLRVAAMPSGEDPAEMVAAEGGAERFRKLVEAAVELPAFQVGLVLDRTDLSSPAERDRALAEVAPILAAMGEGASRNDLVRLVAERLELEPALVMGRLTAAAAAERRDAAGARSEGRRRSAPRARADLAGAPRAVAAGDVHRAARGGEGYLARLNEGHLSSSAPAPPPGSPTTSRTRRPTSRDDAELAGLIAELVIVANERARLGRVDGAQLHAARAGPPRGRDRRRRRGRGSRAPRRAQPRAGGAGRADRPRPSGSAGLTGKFSRAFPG